MRVRGNLKRLVTGLSLLIPACADDSPVIDDRPPPAMTVIKADFVCGSELVRTEFRSERMILTLGTKHYPLDLARSGSGARYTGDSPDGPVEFWNKGRDARLTIGSRTFPECHQQGAAR